MSLLLCGKLWQMFSRQALFLVLSISAAIGGQNLGPKGLYCGGNEMLQYARPIRTSMLEGSVFDVSGKSIPGARVQLQVQGSESIFLDLKADAQGRFFLPKLPHGKYWLGVSHPGFQLHVWDLRIGRFGGTRKLRCSLVVGT